MCVAFYDKDGNVLTDGTLTNTWNYKDQLTQVVKGATTTTYQYDSNGNRVRALTGTTNTYYPTKYYTYDGTTKTKDIYAGNTLVASVTTVGATVTPYYDHTDQLGSIIAATNSMGAQTESLDYYPYGNQRISTGGYTSIRQYIGERYDSSGLTYLNARYYDGNKGRFVSEDPMFWQLPQQLLLDPQQQNSYSYGRDNPVTMSDPSGKSTIALDFGNPSINFSALSPLVTQLGIKTLGWIGVIIFAVSPTHTSNDADLVTQEKTENVPKVSNEPKHTPQPSGNSNPYKGPVDEPVNIVDPDGNVIPVQQGEQLHGSPDGKWVQVKDAQGDPTGGRIDNGHPESKHPDPRSQQPHAHVPGVSNPDGTPWLPVKGS